MLRPLQASLLDQIPYLKHGFFTRQGGISKGIYASLNFRSDQAENPEAILENQRRLEEWFRHSSLILLDQVHGDQILSINSPLKAELPLKADGMITNTPGLILGVRSADCVPILLADPHVKLIGAIHSGWRGTLQNIAGKAIQKMKSHGARIIHAVLGPAIDQDFFEVGPEVFEAFKDHYECFFKPSFSPGRYLCNLKGIVTHQLKAAGAEQVEILPYDTYSNPELFFSCRRSSHQGQSQFGCQLSAIMVL